MKQPNFFLTGGILLTMVALQAYILRHNDMENQNLLTESEKQAGWQLLFDGKSTKGWHNFNQKSTSDKWKVVNGELMMAEKGAGDLVTDAEFENFELELEWKISESGNSGIFYLVKEDPKYATAWLTGPEMQVLDDDKHPDAKQGKDGNRTAGSLYDLIPAKDKKVNTVGEWNKVRIVVNKGKVEHWFNGDKVVTYDLNSQVFTDLVAGSKFVKMPDFAKYRKGRIALQDHGDLVWFKNIKVKKL
ncbi:MAG: DUF1080 domain-containing protein [Verrucomicrobia bacterium]|nr:DUF1080 domain-containing protein [Cytophagales bacterium]